MVEGFFVNNNVSNRVIYRLSPCNVGTEEHESRPYCKELNLGLFIWINNVTHINFGLTLTSTFGWVWMQKISFKYFLLTLWPWYEYFFVSIYFLYILLLPRKQKERVFPWCYVFSVRLQDTWFDFTFRVLRKNRDVNTGTAGEQLLCYRTAVWRWVKVTWQVWMWESGDDSVHDYTMLHSAQ